MLLDAAYDTSLRDLRPTGGRLAALSSPRSSRRRSAVAIIARWLVPTCRGRRRSRSARSSRRPTRRRPPPWSARLQPPHRLMKILEGESLLNDASALLIYRLAVVAGVRPPRLVGSVAAGVLAHRLGSIVARPRAVPRHALPSYLSGRAVPDHHAVRADFRVWISRRGVGLSGILTHRPLRDGGGATSSDAGAPARAVLRGVGDDGVRPERLRLRHDRPAAAARSGSVWSDASHGYGLVALIVLATVVAPRFVWVMGYYSVVRWNKRRGARRRDRARRASAAGSSCHGPACAAS